MLQEDYIVSEKRTIHGFDLILQPQNAQENFSQKVQCSQKGNEYKHKASTHSRTNNRIPTMQNVKAMVLRSITFQKH